MNELRCHLGDQCPCHEAARRAAGGGMKLGYRVRHTAARRDGTVAGIRRNMLWIRYDGEPGALAVDCLDAVDQIPGRGTVHPADRHHAVMQGLRMDEAEMRTER